MRANRTLICHDPLTYALSEMDCPSPLTTEDDDDDDWDGVNLRAFGPSFAAIKGFGDGCDSSVPLPEDPKPQARVVKLRKRTQELKKGVYPHTFFA